MHDKTNIELKIVGESQETVNRYQEIFMALLTTGALSGVRGGKAILHFDADGVFQGVELDYFPWRRRKK